MIGNVDRARADDPQRSPRHQVWRSRSRSWPGPASASTAPTCPSLLRALVACGWFGIQTWVGGEAIFQLLDVLIGAELTALVELPVLGINAVEFACFLAFWALAGGHHPSRRRVDPAAREPSRRRSCSSWAWRCWSGPTSGPTGLGRCSRRPANSGPVRPARASFGGCSSRASRPWSGFGPRCPSTSRTSRATPNRSATRCSARRSGCRRR